MWVTVPRQHSTAFKEAKDEAAGAAAMVHNLSSQTTRVLQDERRPTQRQFSRGLDACQGTTSQ